jgi:hypothetical protein
VSLKEEAEVSEPQNRLRPQITATVHPATVTRMAVLTTRIKMSRGRLIDRLVLILHAMYTSDKVYCMTGEPCRFNRTDVPPIF